MMKQVYVKTRKEWRNWLNHHHDKCIGVWLVFYKKQTGKPALEYDEVVEEALCFGWIDSIIKKIDDEKIELKRALTKSKKAREFFDQLAPSYRKQFISWIAVAKRQETKERRVRESIVLLERGEKLGMK